MPPDFSDLDEALAIAKRSARSSDGLGLTDLLTLSSGFEQGNPDIEIYRPFYAAGLWLRNNPKHIIKATGTIGAEYVNPEVAIASLMRLQAAEDARLGLEVPVGYEADVPATTGASHVFAGVAR